MKKHKCLLAFLSIAGTIAVTQTGAYAQSYQSYSSHDQLGNRNLQQVQWFHGRPHINIVREDPIVHRPPAPEAPKTFLIDTSLPGTPPAQVVQLTGQSAGDPMLGNRVLAPAGWESNVHQSPVASRPLPPGTSVPIVATPTFAPAPAAGNSRQVTGRMGAPAFPRGAHAVPGDVVLMQSRPGSASASSGSHAETKVTGKINPTKHLLGKFD